MTETSTPDKRSYVWLSEYLEDERVRERLDANFEHFLRRARLKRFRLTTRFKPWSPSNLAPEHEP